MVLQDGSGKSERVRLEGGTASGGRHHVRRAPIKNRRGRFGIYHLQLTSIVCVRAASPPQLCGEAGSELAPLPTWPEPLCYERAPPQLPREPAC